MTSDTRPRGLLNFIHSLRSSHAQKRTKPVSLFGGDDQMFCNNLAGVANYAEYGSGESTIWVAENTNAAMTTVDTSQEWLDHVKQAIGADRSVQFNWIDCGILGDWGVPKSFAKRENFLSYAQCIWKNDAHYDLILVDGRFRVLCFLVALKNAESGTKLIFDDYTDRRHYHVVEEFAPRIETCGRQCLFMVPPKSDLDMDKLDHLIDKFEYIWS